ncbi:zinc-binding alcohol dehydrogenase [Lipingzhangella sp. LS1_29]|uniref:Zinc-binding alcohol dehydrogenase n=1 Tax=Lipingzhangella rawalii TaxID=2055835 RepID=A0ABU2H7M5_9ACTN|nr:zinc-binding alcohol dehydrogenase [Lipingzhangella rawalii]MDS1271293.1 zinc-binding alcohol dehydrogenase [Lipingzhangella rawalii]
MPTEAEALWLRAVGDVDIRPVTVPDPGPDEVLIRTRFSAVSRGTEALVLRGGVPPEQRESMRAPFQEGAFPAPVKYGYLNVGVVEQGPAAWTGTTVFCLYPHQTHYVVPTSAVVPVPSGVPDQRAVLAGTVETAVNALWDAAPRIGDRITVLGAGMVGCAVARLCAGIPGVEVQLVDVESERAGVAAHLGADFATPPEAAGERDLVVHCSATEEGLAHALELAGFEATVLELSWYGDQAVRVPLGAGFHSRRLTLRSSQVGTVSPARQARRSSRQRMELALELLRDPTFDALVTSEGSFAELPRTLPRLARERPPGLAHRVTYAADTMPR